MGKDMALTREQRYCVTITGVPIFLYDTVARQWFEPNDLPPHLIEFAKQLRPREDILQLPLISIIECRQFGYAKVVQFRMVGDAAL